MPALQPLGYAYLIGILKGDIKTVNSFTAFA
jgi:hypothetical protein